MKYIPFIFMVSLILSGCAPKTPSSADMEHQTSLTGNSYAAQLASIGIGEQRILQNNGANVSVLGGKFYTSALGENCRQLITSEGSSQIRTAVCNGKNGWYNAEPIFENIR